MIYIIVKNAAIAQTDQKVYKTTISTVRIEHIKIITIDIDMDNDL